MDPVTSTGGAAAPASTTPAAPTTARAKVSGTQANVPAASAFRDDLAKATEKLQPVKGHAYDKVMSGARKGMYVNTSHNARDGQAFRLEHHGGRAWHVYGEGADRVVIAFAKPGAAPAATTTGSPATTPATTSPAAAATTSATTNTPTVTTPAATTTTSVTTPRVAPAAVLTALPGGGTQAPEENSSEAGATR